LEPNQPNPYQTPQPLSEETRNPAHQPTGFDWYFAIVIGLFAIFIVFVTTYCWCAVLLLVATYAGFPISASRGDFVLNVVLAISSLVSFAAGIWSLRRYLKYVRQYYQKIDTASLASNPSTPPDSTFGIAISDSTQNKPKA